MKISPDWLQWNETRALIAAFAGQPLRFVGGCVRDAVLGRSVKDVDAATPMPPQEVMALLKKAGITAIPTGIDHGTVTAVIDGRHFEVTTLRKDVSTDGRRATVAYTDDWKEDAARRDFTMNAINVDADGTLSDYYDGVTDAKAGRVRFIGDAGQRIREDALRILRFFRFYAHYGSGNMDAQGLAACGAQSALIDGLSGERIQQEMLKLLASPRAGEVADIMQQAGVLRRVIDASLDTAPLTRLPEALRIAKEEPDSVLALAALLRNGGADEVVKVISRWKLSNAQAKRLSLLCAGDVQPTANEAQAKRQIRALGQRDYIDLILLHMAEAGDHAMGLAAITLARTWEVPVFPVTGDDLKSIGIAQGKVMGETLRKLETLWEDSGYVLDKAALLKRV